jgi:hypothetical protein
MAILKDRSCCGWFRSVAVASFWQLLNGFFVDPFRSLTSTADFASQKALSVPMRPRSSGSGNCTETRS